MPITVAGKTIETDEEGYLSNRTDWNEEVAKEMAKVDNAELTQNHWEVINFLREYYEEYQIAPAVRVLTKAIGKKLRPEQGNSKYPNELVPPRPAKRGGKLPPPAETARLRLSGSIGRYAG